MQQLGNGVLVEVVLPGDEGVILLVAGKTDLATQRRHAKNRLDCGVNQLEQFVSRGFIYR